MNWTFALGVRSTITISMAFVLNNGGWSSSITRNQLHTVVLWDSICSVLGMTMTWQLYLRKTWPQAVLMFVWFATRLKINNVLCFEMFLFEKTGATRVRNGWRFASTKYTIPNSSPFWCANADQNGDVFIIRTSSDNTGCVFTDYRNGPNRYKRVCSRVKYYFSSHEIDLKQTHFFFDSRMDFIITK
jgi:hypothetical protein